MDDARWEYRIWPEDTEPYASRISARAGSQPAAEARTDTYLLTADENLLAKIRGGERFEIKELLETRRGCERWMLAVSTPFPVGARHLEQLLGDARDMPTAKALIEAAQETLQIVSVRKDRLLFSIGTTRAEITRVSLSGRSAISVALEAPDADSCARFAEELGLAESENIDYGSMLRAVFR